MRDWMLSDSHCWYIKQLTVWMLPSGETRHTHTHTHTHTHVQFVLHTFTGISPFNFIYSTAAHTYTHTLLDLIRLYPYTTKYSLSSNSSFMPWRLACKSLTQVTVYQGGKEASLLLDFLTGRGCNSLSWWRIHIQVEHCWASSVRGEYSSEYTVFFFFCSGLC